MQLPSSVYVKFGTAGGRLHALSSEVERQVAQLWKNGVVLERDARNGDYVWIMRAPPGGAAAVSLLAGEFVQDLRSALDLLASEASLPGMAGLSGFPFGGSSYSELSPLDPRLRAVIDDLQRRPASANSIRWLDDLATADRVRGLAVRPIGRRPPGIGVPGANTGRPLALGVSVRSGEFFDGDEVLRLSYGNPPEAIENIRPVLSYDFSIDEPSVSGPVVPRLSHLYDSVRRDVVPAFSGFF